MITFFGDEPALSTEKEEAVLTVEGVAGVLLRFASGVDGGGSYITDSATCSMLGGALLDAVAVLKMDDDKKYSIVEA